VRPDKRSANHRRAVEKVAELHRKVRRQRLDHAHKTALKLVREHDFIAHEDLRIRNMVRTAPPKPDPDKPGAFLPNGAAAKTGGRLLRVSTFATKLLQTCLCGAEVRKTLADRVHSCPACGLT
jgi:transposase